MNSMSTFNIFLYPGSVLKQETNPTFTISATNGLSRYPESKPCLTATQIQILDTPDSDVLYTQVQQIFTT